MSKVRSVPMRKILPLTAAILVAIAGIAAASAAASIGAPSFGRGYGGKNHLCH